MSMVVIERHNTLRSINYAGRYRKLASEEQRVKLMFFQSLSLPGRMDADFGTELVSITTLSILR